MCSTSIAPSIAFLTLLSLELLSISTRSPGSPISSLPLSCSSLNSPFHPPFSLASTVSICRLSFDTQIRFPSRNRFPCHISSGDVLLLLPQSPPHNSIHSFQSTATASFPPFLTLLASLSSSDHVRLLSHIDSPPRCSPHISPHHHGVHLLHRLSRRWTSGRRVFGWPMISPVLYYPCYFYHQSTTLFL